MIKVNKIVAGSDGSVTTTLIQEIPAKSEDAIYILNPTVKVDMGNAESMDFSLQAGTEFYDSFTQITTYIQVIYDGTTIFYGRVLTIDDGAFGTRKVHCEGALSFLNDSFFPAKPEKARDNISIYEHISEVLANHNNQLGDPLRSIYIGQVPGHYSSSISPDQMIDNDSREFGSSSLVESKSMLEDLKSHYGGCFRIRYSGGRCYLDWMKHYFQSTVNEQSIEVGVNLIDIGSSTEVSNIFTAVIPIGKAEEAKEGEDRVYISYNGRNYMKVPEVTNFYSDSELNSGYHTAKDYKNAIKNYGLIFKTVDIQEGTTPEILLQKTAQWIKENYQGSIKSFSVKAIDMRMIGNSTQKILAGDRVLIRYITGTANKTKGKIVEDTITCISVTYDLFNPENNQYSFGIPANSLSKNYSTKGKTQQKVSNAATPTSASSFSDPAPTDPNEAWRQAVYAELKRHKTWYKSTGNQETGPEDRASVPNKQRIWHAHETMTDGKTNYEVWIPNAPHYITGQSVYVDRVRGWDRDSRGRPLGSWLVGTEEQLTITFLRSKFLFEYMKDEHGVDLTTDLSVPMPGTYTDEAGNTTFTTATPVIDPDTGQVVSETMAIFGQFNSETGAFEFTSPLEFGAFDPEHGIWNFLGSENSGYISQLIDGVYHYFQVDPDHPNKFIEVTNIRDLHIKQVNTEDFIGTMTTGGLIEENGRINTYKFGQEILKNQYEGGDIVVAHVDGDKLMLGSENTMWSYNVASRINGQWVQPYIYTYDPDTKKGERVYIQERAGTMSYRGYYDSDPNSDTFGEFILQETGSHGPHGERIISITGNGIWDDKNLALKGGIITGKVGDDYVSYIKSDRLVVGNASTELTVMQALVDAGVVTPAEAGRYSSQALVAKSVYTTAINALNVRCGTIESNYVETRLLRSTIGAITDGVICKRLSVTESDGYISSPSFRFTTGGADYKAFTLNLGDKFTHKFIAQPFSPGPGVSNTYRNVGLKAEELTGDDEGKIRISFTDGFTSTGGDGTGAAVFNIAATKKYTDGVAASWNNARNAMVVPSSDIGHSPNPTVTIKKPKTYAAYNDASGDARFTLYDYTMQLTEHPVPGASAYKCIDLLYNNNAVARLDINQEWNQQYTDGHDAGYSEGLPSGISIGDLTYRNSNWSTSGKTRLNAFAQNTIWSNSDYKDKYGYLSFPVTVHGTTKTYYFAFDNRKLESNGNAAYGAGYKAGKASVPLSEVKFTSNGTYTAGSGGGYSKVEVAVPQSTPARSVSVVDAGTAPETSIYSALYGWSPVKGEISVPASQPQVYRYIKFKVDGEQRSIYFA